MHEDSLNIPFITNKGHKVKEPW